MKILVGYDGSKEARDALKLAQMHAKAFDAKLEVVKSMTRHQPLDYSSIQATKEKLKREVRYLLDGDNSGCEAHLLVSSHSTGRNLVRFAEVEKTDEIIIGAGNKSRIGKLLLGSTAQHVVLNAPCPVVTLK